jgi:hypothetical protein
MITEIHFHMQHKSKNDDHITKIFTNIFINVMILQE